jgi:glycosyltransferase involved in cell wall biosynthesis
MRIMQVNWGWPPKQTGGPIGYTADLSREFCGRGHQVSVFYGGDYDFKNECHLSLREEGGIKLGSVVNSPNLFGGFGFPLKECQQPVIEEMFREFVQINRPQLIHFHSLIGLSGSLLETAKEMNIPTVVSLHNYWFICPRSDFLRPPDYTLCPGPSGGDGCARCIPRPSASTTKRDRAKYRIKCLIKRNVRLKRLMQRGRMHLLRAAYRYLPVKENGHDPSLACPPSGEETEGYRFRETFLRDQLVRNADLLIAVSRPVKRIFAQHGIPAEKILMLHSGIKQAESLESFARCTSEDNGGPVRFAFFGPVLPYKGVHVLIDAFNRLARRGARLLVFGTGDTSYMVKLMRKANSSVEFKGAFSRLTQILPQFDVAVVPPIWHDNAPLVVLEALAARKPIIGADIGGIPDFVNDGTNGFLFRAGDPEDLARTMQKVIDHPGIVRHFRQNITTPRTMRRHATELEEVYGRLLTGREVSELEVDQADERTCA